MRVKVQYISRHFKRDFVKYLLYFGNLIFRRFTKVLPFGYIVQFCVYDDHWDASSLSNVNNNPIKNFHNHLIYHEFCQPIGLVQCKSPARPFIHRSICLLCRLNVVMKLRYGFETICLVWICITIIPVYFFFIFPISLALSPLCVYVSRSEQSV